MRHTICDVKTVIIASLLPLLSELCAAQNEIDRAFEMQNAPVRNHLSVDNKVKNAQDNAQNNVTDRYEAKERARAEAMRNYGNSASNSKPEKNNGANFSGSWKVVKQYEGGFSDFGLALRSTLYVVRCINGAEHKMYRDKRGLWGSIGLGWNNAFSTLEDAAGEKCK